MLLKSYLRMAHVRLFLFPRALIVSKKNCLRRHTVKKLNDVIFAGIKMTKANFEVADFLHKQWRLYSDKHDINKDIEVLIKVVEDNTAIARNETEVLATVYDSALVVLDSTSTLDKEEKARASYFSYSLSLQADQDCGAYINKKGEVRIGHKFFLDTLNQKSSPAIGVLELMYTILHELLHGVFPELDEDAIIEKTEKVWTNGMKELIK
jgi:hypothetical protein